MRFLADESCDFAVVRALRATGHDVSAMVEISPGAEDEAVLAIARSEARVLLTEDKDFGKLAYADGQGPPESFWFAFPQVCEGRSDSRLWRQLSNSAITSLVRSWWSSQDVFVSRGRGLQSDASRLTIG